MTPHNGRPYGIALGAWLFGLLGLAAVVVLILRITELQRFATLAEQAQPFWLAAAALLQVLTYVCASAVWYAVLRREGVRRQLRSLVPLGVAKLFTDQALPTGGISGTLLIMRGLDRRGVPAPVAMGALLVGLVSFYAAYALAGFTGLLVLQLYHPLGPAMIVVGVLFAGFVVGVPAMVLYARQPSAKRRLRWLHRLPAARSLMESVTAAPPDLLRDRGLLLVTTALQLAVFVLDAATLGVMLRAIGQTAPSIFVFAAFMVADVIATIGPIPLGLGAFEGTAVAMLNLNGVSIEAAVTATLLLRGFTFWLPMLPGLWLARRELAGARPVEVIGAPLP